jgi:hypothetical protein
MGVLALVPTLDVRQCMNCGRPQDHRWHDRDPNGWGVLPNGCAYAITQPQTLWNAVLRKALADAAQSVGASVSQAYDELAREWS